MVLERNKDQWDSSMDFCRSESDEAHLCVLAPRSMTYLLVREAIDEEGLAK